MNLLKVSSQLVHSTVGENSNTKLTLLLVSIESEQCIEQNQILTVFTATELGNLFAPRTLNVFKRLVLQTYHVGRYFITSITE